MNDANNNRPDTLLNIFISVSLHFFSHCPTLLPIHTTTGPQAIKSITITALKLWYWIKVTGPFSQQPRRCVFLSLTLSVYPSTFTTAWVPSNNNSNGTSGSRPGKKKKYSELKTIFHVNFGLFGMCRWHPRKAQVFGVFFSYSPRPSFVSVFSFRCLILITSICLSSPLTSHRSASVLIRSDALRSRFDGQKRREIRGNRWKNDFMIEWPRWLISARVSGAGPYT